ncbi:MAG: hypothetical protein M1812_001010 [Candelaria pacifica]|nr:MAG: hypothetical protein M1812_001010 [Candelaria pacifica]
MDISGHRKIELQSPLDLTYLQTNISRSARAKLDLNLPPAPGEGEDKLRNRVEELVDEYLQKTFDYARQNILINGLDLSTASSDISTIENSQYSAAAAAAEVEEYEPYDSRLATRVQTLYSTLESETLRLTLLRRTAPSTAASNFRTAFTGKINSDSQVADGWGFEAGKGGEVGKGHDGGFGKEVGVGNGEERNTRLGDMSGGKVKLERGDEVKEVYGRGIDRLVYERGALTESAARLERAGSGVREVEGRR